MNGENQSETKTKNKFSQKVEKIPTSDLTPKIALLEVSYFLIHL